MSITLKTTIAKDDFHELLSATNSQLDRAPKWGFSILSNVKEMLKFKKGLHRRNKVSYICIKQNH